MVPPPIPRRPIRPSDPSSATLPVLGLGCSSFSSFFRSGDAAAVSSDDYEKKQTRRWIDTVRTALDHGINVLDTAPWYGHGTSEITVGLALKEALGGTDGGEGGGGAEGEDGGRTFRRHRREDVRIHTKVGRYDAEPARMFDFSRAAVLSSCRRSLARMGCGYVDLLQLHDPEFAPSVALLVEVTVPAMEECRERGWTRELGITGYPLEVQHEILLRCADAGLTFDVSLTYCHFNWHDASLFERSPAFGDSSFHDACADRGVAVLAAAPLSMGLLTPGGPPDWHPASPALQEACRRAVGMCDEEGASAAQLALAYAVHAGAPVPCTLLGMADAGEVEEAAAVARRAGAGGALEDVLEDGERRALRRILAEDGPFREVRLSGERSWDGVKIAAEFWEGVGGGRAAAEERMRGKECVL